MSKLIVEINLLKKTSDGAGYYRRAPSTWQMYLYSDVEHSQDLFLENYLKTNN